MNLPTVSADEVLRDLGAVLGEVGFHDADLRVLDREHEARFLPELARRVPRLLRRRAHDEPALVAGTHDLRVRRLRQELRARALVGAGSREAGGRGDLVAVVVAWRGEVGRQLERGAGRHRLVVDALARRDAGQRLAAGERQRETRRRPRGRWQRVTKRIRSCVLTSLLCARQPASRSAARTVS